jgi:hypothetical protein
VHPLRFDVFAKKICGNSAAAVVKTKIPRGFEARGEKGRKLLHSSAPGKKNLSCQDAR